MSIEMSNNTYYTLTQPVAKCNSWFSKVRLFLYHFFNILHVLLQQII